MKQQSWTPIALATLLLGLAALTLSGCAVFRGSPGFNQLDVVGEMEIVSFICASGSSAGCASVGNSAGAFDSPAQVLLGYRVATDVLEPASFASVGPEAVGFTASPTYTAELERLAPTDTTRKWVGYITGTLNYTTTTVPQEIVVRPRFGLPQGADGSPFAGPFPHRPVVGVRPVGPSLPADRPVDCGIALATLQESVGICVDSPAPAVLATDAEASTRDLGVLAAGPVSAAQGSLASAPFTLRYAGLSSYNAIFSLSATTTLPGATAAVTPPTLFPPTDSDTSIPVAVGIPPNAAPGTYDIVFTAKLGNGQTRTQTRKLVVTNAPGGSAAGGPGAIRRAKLSVILPRGLTVAAARRSGVVVLIGSSRRVPARISLFQGPAKKAKAAKGVRLKSPGPTRVVLKSARLVPGKFRIVIRSEERNIVRRGTLRR